MTRRQYLPALPRSEEPRPSTTQNTSPPTAFATFATFPKLPLPPPPRASVVGAARAPPASASS